jgi:hypothetical protein
VKDWATAARSREEKRPILAHAFFQGPLVWDEKTAAGEFALPEVIALVNERYVALKLGPGVTVPFAAPELYGLGAHTFGTALLVCAPDGRVVLDRFGPAWEVLVEGLTAIPDLPGPPAPHFQEPLAQARALLRRGELAGALAVAQPVGTAAAAAGRPRAAPRARRRGGLAAIVAAKRRRARRARERPRPRRGRLPDQGRPARRREGGGGRVREGAPRRSALDRAGAVLGFALANFPYPPDYAPLHAARGGRGAAAVAPAPPRRPRRSAPRRRRDWLVKTQCADGSWARPSQYARTST